MKKVLFGTTALAGIALFAGTAAAQLDVRIGGQVGFQAGFWDADIEESDKDFLSESEVVVTADGRADNGLLYGAKVELFASTSDVGNSDETVIYLSGQWGRLEFGDQDGGGDRTFINSPTVGIGGIDGAFDDFVPASTPKFDPADTGDDTKITYISPRFAGFQAAASYVPEGGDAGTGENVGDSDRDDAFELGANYQGTFGGVGFVVGGAYNRGGDDDDLESWGLGTQIAFAGFTVGGDYFENKHLDGDGWSVGAVYETGPFGVGAGYSTYDEDDGIDQELFALSAVYAIAPGLTVAGDLGFFDTKFAGGGDNDGVVAVTELKVAF